MPEWLPVLVPTLILVSLCFGAVSLWGRSLGPWAPAWAALLLSGFAVALSGRWPPVEWASVFFASLFPFLLLIGAFVYAARKVPGGLLPCAIGVGLLRTLLVASGRVQAAAGVALAVDPSLALGAAWIVHAAAGHRKRRFVHRLLAPGLVAIAAAELVGAFEMFREGIDDVPWSAWVGVSIPFVSIQIVAMLDTERSRRTRAEQALRESEARVVGILSSLTTVRVVVVDRLGQVEDIYGQSSSEGRYGVDLDQLKGTPSPKLLAAADSEHALHAIEDVFDTGQTREFRQELKLPNGEFCFDIGLSPLRDSSGQVHRVLVVARDITRQVREEDERKSFEARLQRGQKLESLGVLAGGIAHDFNNLLMGILGNAELALERVAPDSNAADLIGEILTASQRAAGVTGQLLAFVGKRQRSVRTLDMSRVVEETVRLLRGDKLAASALQIEAPRLIPWIRSDPSQIGQVTINLITNALESLPEAGGSVRVHTGVMAADGAYLASCYPDTGLAEGNHAYLDVSDTGCGIPPADVLRIFDPFFTSRFQGRGLGLAVVIGIVRAHGGTLRVRSEPGRGTAIRVLFPLAEAASAAEREGSPVEAEAYRGRGTILVVDDEDLVRRAVCRLLDANGFEALEAANGPDALRVFAEHRDAIAAVILDLTMPNMDGAAVFEALRASSDRLPVVIMSGHSEQDMADRISARGRVESLQKPFGLSELTAKLQRVIESSPGKAAS